jgi:hypothetical protein
MKTLNSYALKDLKKAISKYNIRGYSKMNKPQLIKFMLSRENYDKFKFMHDEKMLPSIKITEAPKKIKKKETKTKPVPKLEKKQFKIKLPKDRPKIKLTQFPDTEEKPKGKGPIKNYTQKEIEELNKKKLSQEGIKLKTEIRQILSEHFGELMTFKNEQNQGKITPEQFDYKEDEQEEETAELIFDEIDKEDYSRQLVQSFYTQPIHSNFGMRKFITALNKKYVDIKTLRTYKEFEKLSKIKGLSNCKSSQGIYRMVERLDQYLKPNKERFEMYKGKTKSDFAFEFKDFLTEGFQKFIKLDGVGKNLMAVIQHKLCKEEKDRMKYSDMLEKVVNKLQKKNKTNDKIFEDIKSFILRDRKRFSNLSKKATEEMIKDEDNYIKLLRRYMDKK